MSEGMAQRLQEVRKHFHLTASQMAERAGLSDRKSWERYERGQSVPKADTLSRVASMGIDSHWLLTGQGLMLRGAQPTTHQAVQSAAEDQELMALIVDGIIAVYKGEGVGLPPRDLGRLAERMRADLVNAYDNPGDRKIAVKGMLAQLRRDLVEAPAGAESKRRA